MFHKHNLVLIDKTYSPPVNREVSGGLNESVFERMLHGCTSYVWKCSEATCSKVVTKCVLGKSVDK